MHFGFTHEEAKTQVQLKYTEKYLMQVSISRFQRIDDKCCCEIYNLQEDDHMYKC